MAMEIIHGHNFATLWLLFSSSPFPSAFFPYFFLVSEPLNPLPYMGIYRKKPFGAGEARPPSCLS